MALLSLPSFHTALVISQKYSQEDLKVISDWHEEHKSVWSCHFYRFFHRPSHELTCLPFRMSSTCQRSSYQAWLKASSVPNWRSMLAMALNSWSKTRTPLTSLLPTPRTPWVSDNVDQKHDGIFCLFALQMLLPYHCCRTCWEFVQGILLSADEGSFEERRNSLLPG